MLVYQPKADPAARTVDSKSYTGTGIGTKLELALSKLAEEVRALSYKVVYYDFRYPNATRMIIIADTGWFRVKVPASLPRFERSLSTNGNAYLDDVRVIEGGGWTSLTDAQLRPDQYHEVEAQYWGEERPVALVLIYGEPR